MLHEWEHIKVISVDVSVENWGLFKNYVAQKIFKWFFKRRTISRTLLKSYAIFEYPLGFNPSYYVHVAGL